MKTYMIQAFESVYSLESQPFIISDQTKIEALRKENGSWVHLFGAPLPFSFQTEGYFPWGFVQLQLQSDKGIVQAARVYTDAMDWALPQAIEQALTGCKFKKPQLITALYQALPEQQAKDIAQLLETSSL